MSKNAVYVFEQVYTSYLDYSHFVVRAASTDEAIELILDAVDEGTSRYVGTTKDEFRAVLRGQLQEQGPTVYEATNSRGVIWSYNDSDD